VCVPLFVVDFIYRAYIQGALCVGLSVCPLVTRERLGRLSSNFLGSSRAPEEGLRHQKCGVIGRGPEIYTFQGWGGVKTV